MVSEATIRTANVVAEHERSTMEETNKIVANEAEEAKKIREKYVEVSFNNRRLFDLEVVKEGEKSTETVQRGKQRLEDLRVENRLSLMKLNDDLAAANKLKLLELEKDGQKDVERRKNRHAEMEKKIGSNKEKTEKALDREIQINEAIQRGKTKIALDGEAKKDKKRKEHEQTVLNLKQESADIKSSFEDKLSKNAEKMRIENKQRSRELQALKSTMILGNTRMLKAAQMDHQHDVFRRDCRTIVHMFNESKRSFDNEELAVMITVKEMRSGEKGSQNYVPKLHTVSSAIETFKDKIQKLVTPDDKYENLQIQTIRTASQLSDEIRTMNTEIHTLRNLKTGDPEIIEKSLVNARKFFLELGELVLLFNIRRSTHIGDALALEMSNVTQKSTPVTAQIQNGSSSSAMPAITNGSFADDVDSDEEHETTEDTEDGKHKTSSPEIEEEETEQEVQTETAASSLKTDNFDRFTDLY
ncbi:unnamed protein product [Caenorhabditis brenneri]